MAHGRGRGWRLRARPTPVRVARAIPENRRRAVSVNPPKGRGQVHPVRRVETGRPGLAG